MKTYKTQAEVEADIKDGWLIIKDDVNFECDVKIDANIDARNIYAGNIEAWEIKARNIDAWNIDAGKIKARNIDAWNIYAGNIEARNISYYAVCFAYNNITCKSISARRENGRHFVLDGEIKIEKEK